MDMRRLIDETDFDNLNELSKRWKKEPSLPPSHSHSQLNTEERPSLDRSNISMERAPQKENMPQQSNSSTLLQPSPVEYQRKKQVMPQIMDEDTEHFRNRLQHLLNSFKTDAVSEFMGMKRSMLDYQKETIKNDTQRYLTMYEEKHQELLGAKEKLIALTTDLERKTIQIDLMSAHIARLNDRLRIAKHLSRPFSLLYENKLNQKMLRLKMADAARRDDRRLKLKAVSGWRNILREGRREREEVANQSRVELEVAEVVGRFQKEMEMLREKLGEATRKNEEYEGSKSLIQENLKKAFLRGISSMNMEAMGIFGGLDHDAPQNEHFQQSNNLAFSRNTPSNLNQTAVLSQNALNQSAMLGNSSVVVGRAKVQSKEHKWREAPVLGMEEKQEVQEPRMQLIRPTTEAKVIRVVDGRSNVDTGRKPPSTTTVPSKVQSGSRKKI